MKIQITEEITKSSMKMKVIEFPPREIIRLKPRIN